MRNVRLAVVQGYGWTEKQEHRNVDEALKHIAEAKEAGAQLVLLSEGYPGPFFRDNTYTVAEAMADAAREHGIYLAWGDYRPAEEYPDYKYIIQTLVGPDGKEIGRQVRSHPTGPMGYGGWGFPYVGGAFEPQVFDTPVGKISIIICTEIYVPELTRIAFLRGAEIILNPVGRPAPHHEAGWASIAHARAQENICYVAVTQQSSSDKQEGIAGIYGPEGVIAKGHSYGVTVADLDLDKLHEWRNPGSFEECLRVLSRGKVMAGMTGWRRPELYHDLINIQKPGVPTSSVPPFNPPPLAELE